MLHISRFGQYHNAADPFCGDCVLSVRHNPKVKLATDELNTGASISENSELKSGGYSEHFQL